MQDSWKILSKILSRVLQAISSGGQQDQARSSSLKNHANHSYLY